MVTKEMLDEVTRRLVQAYDPVAIYLFGSQAWGTPTKDSDIDLALVVEHASVKRIERVREARAILQDIDVAKDIIVYTKDEFDKAIQHPSALAKKILNEGRLLYGEA